MSQEQDHTIYYASAAPGSAGQFILSSSSPAGGGFKANSSSGSDCAQAIYYSIDGSSHQPPGPAVAPSTTTTQYFNFQGRPATDGPHALYGQTSPQTVHMSGSPQVYTIGASSQQPGLQHSYPIQGEGSKLHFQQQHLSNQPQLTRVQVGGQCQPAVMQYQSHGQPPASGFYQAQSQQVFYQQPQNQPQIVQAQASPQTETMILPVQANRPQQQQMPLTTHAIQYHSSPPEPTSTTGDAIYQARSAQSIPAQRQPITPQGQTVTIAPYQSQPGMAASYQAQPSTEGSYQVQPSMAVPYQVQAAIGTLYQDMQPVKSAPYQAQMMPAGGDVFRPQQQQQQPIVFSSVRQTPTLAGPPYGTTGTSIDPKGYTIPTETNQGPQMGYGQPMMVAASSPSYQPRGGPMQQPRGAQQAPQRPTKPNYIAGPPPPRSTSPEFPPRLRQLQPRRSMDKGDGGGPPQFVQHPTPQVVVNEGESIVLKAIVRPAGDPSLTVQWLKNGTVLNASSRHNAILDRGYAEFQFLYTNETDTGEYVCIAQTDKGTAQSTSCVITIVGEERVVTDSQLPEESMIMNLVAMESQLAMNGVPNRAEEKKFTEPPKFARQLLAQLGLKENERAKFETFITPSNDPSLVVEWYKDGEPLKTGCRFTETIDRGYVILDIHYTYPEDSGEYMCIAKNNAGTTRSNAVQLSCKPGNRIVTDSVLSSDSVSYLQSLDSLQISTSQDHRYTASEQAPSAPVFELAPKSTTAIEGTPIRLLVKAGGYPHPRVQWLINGDVLPTIGGGGAWRIYNDGGISYLEFNRCGPPGEYKVAAVAKNNLGEASAECSLVIDPVPDFRPDLKHVAPDNPFRRMASLKRVERTDELSSAFNKNKPKALDLRKLERRSSGTEGMNDTEVLYTQVQASLRSNRQVMPPPQHASQQQIQPSPPQPQPMQPVQPPPQSEPIKMQFGTGNIVDGQSQEDYSITETSAEFQLEL